MDKTQTKNWINFKELRSRLRFSAVLQEYGVQVSQKGDQLVGFCPLPNHNGKRNSASFSAHPEKGIFQCFGCGAKGNILDFAVLMENGDPKRGLDVRKTALKLNRFLAAAPVDGAEIVRPESEKELLVNEPLNFRLSDLDPAHPYLLGRGFTRETMEHFGVGFCSNGVLSGRVAIALHDSSGNLIGYSGRVIDDASISSENPKYLFPGKREATGAILEFKKSRFVYNGHRIKEPVGDLVIVEGFPSVWWLTQCGFHECVALMGSSASAEQLDLILRVTACTARLWIFGDGDDAGERCASELVQALSRRRLCRVIIEAKKQPTDFSPPELKQVLGI